MKEQITAKAYAKAFMSLGKENNIDIASELTKITEVINVSNDLENVLFLEVFTVEEKQNVLLDILKKLSLSDLTKNICLFLINEKRISLFPLVYKEVIVIDDNEKGFLRGSVEGHEEKVESSVIKKLTEYIEKKIGKQAHLKYIQNSSITAGYKVTVDDLQLDATLDNQLEKFKNTVISY